MSKLLNKLLGKKKYQITPIELVKWAEPLFGEGEKPAEGFPEALVASYEAGGLVLVLLDDTNMKVKYPEYGMERDGFTYVLDGDTLTVTAPGEDVLGAFGQIWTAMGGETWTIDGSTATKAG